VSVRSTSSAAKAAKPRLMLLLLLLLFALTASAPSAAEARSASSSRPPPQAELLVAELQEYIPRQLESAQVPGLAIALVRRGEIVWEAGFGVANTFTGSPVTKDSVFEVESLSKPVAAYAALKLVDSGALELDEPIHVSLDESWLPRSEWSDQITLRQLLSHTAGLSNRLHPIDKSIGFKPGERYAYSNVGYQYLQAAIEQVSGSPLEDIASDTVFEPLAMSSSTFADRPDVISRLVSGHINYGADLGALVATVALCFAVVSAVGIAAGRLWKGRWVVTWRLVAICYAIAAMVSLPVVAWLNGGLNKWTLFYTLMIAILSGWLAAWLAGSLLLVRRLPARWRSGWRRLTFGSGSFLCCIMVFALLANAISGPLPTRPPSTPGAAYSMKSTAGDLARFMIELAQPQHLDPGTAAEMSTPQVRTSDSNSWGLGVAIYHEPSGDWLWHAGDDRDFHALMVMCPRTGDGVVVLANGQSGLPVHYDIARRAMGVDFTWSSR